MKEETPFITVSDLFHLLKKSQLKIVVLFSILAFFYAILQPIKYEANASFREKNNAASGIDSSLIDALFMSGGQSDTNSESITTMQSRTILAKVIQKMGLQAEIRHHLWNFPRLGRIKDNLILELSLAINPLKPALKDKVSSLAAKEVVYNEELGAHLKIKFIDNNNYEIYEGKEKVGEGRLDLPFFGGKYSFILYGGAAKNETFSMELHPIAPIIKDLTAKIKIKTDNEDKSLIRIYYCHHNRYIACSLVNNLMIAFQDFLKEEQHRITSLQVTYLQKREEEMATHLKGMMEAYGKNVASDVYHLGFASAEMALDFLSKQQLTLEEKSMAIDLKLKGLENDPTFALENESVPIRHIISEIQELKQHSDSIELALRNSPIQNKEELKAAFIKQSYDLSAIREYNEETKSLLTSLEQGIFPPPAEKLFNDPQFLAKEWYEKLLKTRKTPAFTANKTQYIAYLSHLLRYLQVQEKTIEERMAHQQSLQLDFQGINLKTAQELYHRFSTALSQIESDIAERKFILEQMKEPEFEISSLSSALKDPISAKMIEKASQIVLQLGDDRNRSDIEKERLRKELGIQEKFLTLHLNQNLQLLELSESLLREKIYSIQSATLELIHQKISVLEKQLNDFVITRRQGLKREKELITEHQKVIREQMSKLPEKWVAEKLVEQHLHVNERMVEEITKLVESKSIAKNLEMVQSAPLDLAVIPLNPKSPKLVFLALLGALLGALLTFTGMVLNAVIYGVPASRENLELAGVHVAGVKHPNKDPLSLLRRLITFFGQSAEGRSLLIMRGKEDALLLANLWIKQGNKVVIISVDFNERKESEGVLEVIQGKISDPKVISLQGVDMISAGGFTPYGAELLRTKAFENLMKKLKIKYHWVIATSEVAPDTSEAEEILSAFDCAAIYIKGERLKNLEVIMAAAKSKRISFIISNEKRENQQ